MIREMRKKGVVPRLRTLKMALISYKMHGILEEEREFLLLDLVKAGLEEEEAETFLKEFEEGRVEGEGEGPQ